MPDRSTQTAIDKVEALLKMIREDGETPRGQLPPAEYVDALEKTDRPGRAHRVAESHKNSNGPPTKRGGRASEG